ncbi:MAG: Glu-tRNA(Gln) amidotransferase subunit GatD [Nanoarchaeota archaeon]
MVELNFSAGDRVRLRLADGEQDGIVIESPDSSLILLKLDSGYNVGVRKENILASRVLKRYAPVANSDVVKQKEGLPSVGLIITGGTIASKASQATGGVQPITDVNEFLRFYPELMDIVNVKRIEVPFKMFSENMDSSHWIELARQVKIMLDDDSIKGVIISHGTDTLHYTSAALSFFLKNLSKPVVLTYSQRSIDRASSDAHLNLQCAARMALSDCGEVMLVGHANENDDFCYALRGSKVKKLHSSRRDAFKPVNCIPIAKVWSNKVEFLDKYRKAGNGKTELDIEFSDKVALVKYYPGQSVDILDYYALKYKGIVIEGTGLGHVNKDWQSAIRKHVKSGFVICMASQTTFGRVDEYVYSTARELEGAGVIFLEDMLSETAFVKLGFILGHYGWKKNVKEKMLENFAGELNNRLIK